MGHSRNVLGFFQRSYSIHSRMAVPDQRTFIANVWAPVINRFYGRPPESNWHVSQKPRSCHSPGSHMAGRTAHILALSMFPPHGLGVRGLCMYSTAAQEPWDGKLLSEPKKRRRRRHRPSTNRENKNAIRDSPKWSLGALVGLEEPPTSRNKRGLRPSKLYFKDASWQVRQTEPTMEEAHPPAEGRLVASQRCTQVEIGREADQ